MTILDFTKAFGKIIHNRLIHEFIYYGISGFIAARIETIRKWGTIIIDTIWPLELLTPIIYVQGIIRTITLCTEVPSGHALLTL